MSLTEAVGWTLLRSVILAVLAVVGASRYCRLIDVSGGKNRGQLWCALLLAYFTPVLLVGYAYSNFSLSLVHFPIANELLYSTLLLLRFIPVATVVLRFAPPPPMSAEAIYSARLSRAAIDGRLRRFRAGFGFWIRGPIRSRIPALAIVFLLVFQEFEMASLMGVTAGTFHTPPSWSVWLFDAQVVGLMLDESLWLARLPLACELVVLALALLAVLTGRRLQSGERSPAGDVSRTEQTLLWAGVSVAGIAILVVPLAVVLRGTAEGLGMLLSNLQFFKEILTSVLLAGICGTLATLSAAVFLGSIRSERLRRTQLVGGVIAALPGLAGSLILGLASIAFFQLRATNSLYNTPIPFIATTTLFLLPRAMLLQLLLHTTGNEESAHLAVLLRRSPVDDQRAAGRELLWVTRLRGQIWVWGIVCYWAYWDLTLSSLLLPPGMAAAPVRLYNLMHYGQSAVQSAMLLFAIAIPLLLILSLAGIRRPLLRCLIR